MTLLTLDVETTLNAPEAFGLAHPMHPFNSIVFLGTKLSGKDPLIFTESFSEHLIVAIDLNKPDFIVGSNMSFDLLYLLRHTKSLEQRKIIQSQRLWDIQLAEYLLTGQQAKWASLDEMSIKYGLPIKDSKVSDYFAQGIGSDKIDPAIIIPYLTQDVCNTEAIAMLQMESATKSNQLDLFLSQMEALHCTTEMMFNGLEVDIQTFKDYTVEVATTYADTKVTLEKRSVEFGPAANAYPITDVDSSLQWSKLLFGGTKKVESKEAVGMFKNGKVKYKKVITLVNTFPVSGVIPLDAWKSEKTGKVSVDDKVLSIIVDKTKDPDIKELVLLLQQYREVSKQLSTYIQGLGKHIIEEQETARIYGRLNHVATSTGRLSSASPNLQNISNNPIKKVFVSRYGDDGQLVEFDFSQLEVAVLAHITKDTRLIKDITDGNDIHSELYKNMYGKYPDDATRKWFKRLTFGLIYGAGANTLAENAGCSYDVAKNFIITFYTRYPSVKDWHNIMAASADKLATYDKVGEIYNLSRVWRWVSETKRVYVFSEYKSTYSTSREYTFSPTELKNYPVQGLATGDIVPMMLGILFRKLIDKPGVKIINTVHDSIMLDVRNDVLTETITEVRSILNKTHEFYEATFGIPLALKLNAGCKVGKNWFELTEI